MLIIGEGCSRPQPSSGILLLVADFDESVPHDSHITENVLSNLRQKLGQFEDIQVRELGRVITKEEGSMVARSEGKKNHAAIVVWGWYKMEAETTLLNIFFEVLRPPHYAPVFKLEGEEAPQEQKNASGEQESFIVQTRLPAEMNSLSFFAAGVARNAARDWDEAIALFGNALKSPEEHTPILEQSEIYRNRGNAYSAKGDYGQAITDYSEALRFKPDDFWAYYDRGNAYSAKGDYHQAIADYSEALRLKPNHVWIYYSRGDAYRAKGKYDRAIADYGHAIELQPDFCRSLL